MEEDTTSGATDALERINVTWKHVGILSSAVAAGAITALLVLYGSKKEALTSAAILLAIIAFIFQLVIFIAQALQSSATAVRLEQIAANLARDVGLTHERLQAVSADVKEVRQRGLSSALEDASEELAANPTADPNEVVRLLEPILTEYLGEDAVSPAPPQPRAKVPARAPRLPRMAPPTADERQAAVPVLAGLPDDAFQELIRVKSIDNSVPDYKTMGAWSERPTDDAVLKRLEEEGLLTIWPTPPPDRIQKEGRQTFVSLAPPLGLQAGKVLHEDGFVSRYLHKQPLENVYRESESEEDEDTGGQ